MASSCAARTPTAATAWALSLPQAGNACRSGKRQTVSWKAPSANPQCHWNLSTSNHPHRKALGGCHRQNKLTARAPKCMAALNTDSTGGGSSSSSGTSEAGLKGLADVQTLLTEMAVSDVCSGLPADLKVDLKDAGFALSSGPVLLELGEELGGHVFLLGRALENADISTAAAASEAVVAYAAAGKLPEGSSARASLGRRVLSAGRFVRGIGAFGGGRFTKLSAAMAAAGDALSATAEEKPVNAAAVYGRRSFKVGGVEVELTPSRAYIGAAVAAAFGAAAWHSASALQSVGEDSLQYASDGALSLALSLRATLLAVGYGCAAMSFVAGAGLIGLALQLQQTPPCDSR